jgi:hypothetical protein
MGHEHDEADEASGAHEAYVAVVEEREPFQVHEIAVVSRAANQGSPKARRQARWFLGILVVGPLVALAVIGIVAFLFSG